MLRCGHDTIFRIEINENVELAARHRVSRNIAARQQNLTELLAVEIKAGSRLANYCQEIAFSDFNHVIHCRGEGPVLPARAAARLLKVFNDRLRARPGAKLRKPSSGGVDPPRR